MECGVRGRSFWESVLFFFGVAKISFPLFHAFMSSLIPYFRGSLADLILSCCRLSIMHLGWCCFIG